MITNPSPDDPHVGIRSYASDWLWPTLVPWFLVTFLFVALLAVRSPVALLGLLLLDARLLSPLLGWRSARSALREASHSQRSGSWLITSPAPWWSLAFACYGLAVTGFSLMIFVALSASSFAGFFVAPAVLLIGRIGLEAFWFRRCFRDASRVAVLERSHDPGSGQSFRLLGLDGPDKLVTVKEYDDYSSTVYLMEGGSEIPWKAVESMEGLVLQTPARVPSKDVKEQKK